jgi:hypothetical protein
MNNTNLVRFDNNNIELFINTTTGESFASVSGYARMCNMNRKTIQSRVDKINEGADNTLTFLAEVLTASGLQGCRLITEQLICEWIPKDNPEMATKLMQLGIRGFLHTLAGTHNKRS